tara:strand:+ start:21094 stop:21690 length:597 start_codon:yes stop_codon:yes gene_type:complete
MTVNIREATKKDIDAITLLHLNRFKNFFLSSLGYDFLYTFYTTFIIADSLGRLYCVEINNEIVGFSAVVFDSKGSTGRIVKANLRFFLWYVIKNSFRVKLFINLLKRVIFEKGLQVSGPELLSIATSESTKGIGKALLKYTINELKLLGYSNLSLTTDKYDNESVIAFYKKVGFEMQGDFRTIDDRQMIRFNKNLYEN